MEDQPQSKIKKKQEIDKTKNIVLNPGKDKTKINL